MQFSFVQWYIEGAKKIGIGARLLHQIVLLVLLSHASINNAGNTPTIVRDDLLFTQVSTDDGLSHNGVKRIIQDRYGFIWIGTQQGLNRYNGYEFEVFNYSSDDPGSLSNGWVYDLLEDNAGRLWVATDNGLNLFEPRSKTFRHFQHDPQNPASLSSDNIRSLFQDTNGALWVGTRAGLSRWQADGQFSHFLSFPDDLPKGVHPAVRDIEQDERGLLWIATQHDGLVTLDPDTGETSRFDLGSWSRAGLAGSYIQSLLIDETGTIWVGTADKGIARIDPRSGAVERMVSGQSGHGLSSNLVKKIYQTKTGQIWVATDGGLNLWLPGQQKFQAYRHNPGNPFSLSDDAVDDITEDTGGVLWVGTYNGISKWNPNIANFTQIRRQEQSKNSLSNNKVSSFAEDAQGNLWIGTIGGGVNRWNRDTGRFEVFVHEASRSDSLPENLVTSLLFDERGRLWVGGMRRGVGRMSGAAGYFQSFSHDDGNPSTLSANAVSALLRGRDDAIWVATYGAGLNRHNADDTFTRYPNRQGQDFDFPNYFLLDLEEAIDGTLWLATDGGGVINFDPATQRVRVLAHDENDANSLSGNHVVCLLQTDVALWVGTRDTGLNRYAGGQWRHFDYRDGLPSNAIYGILEDDLKRIWVSHGQGLSMYNPVNGQFTNYTKLHGLQGNDFNSGAFLKTHDDAMLFGGNNGFNIFEPSSIRGNTHVPPVRLTRFTKFNKEFLLDVPTHEASQIQLRHSDYVVGFEFAALDYTDPAKNRYRYMLEGLDRDWVDSSGVRQATYTNLSAGSYTFRVQGSNNDGVWNPDGLAVSVIVAPPIWATWWALASYTFLLLSMVYVAAHVYRGRLQRAEQIRQNERLERLVAERTGALESEIRGHKVAQQELSRSLQEKEVLLKEVHHRVKNNMQVISSLLNIQADSVMDERFVNLLTESQQRIKSMALIHENLYRSDNLLEIDFHQYIEMLANGLMRFYRFDNLALRLELDVVDVFLDIDTAVPCGLIINELVSNALKHAFKGRTGTGVIRIAFQITPDGTHYRFSVSDDGIGIPADMDIRQSSSMGLEIVRILTEQLDGQWTCTSNGGTEFVIEFPRK